jgi:hypothetical protein
MIVGGRSGTIEKTPVAGRGRLTMKFLNKRTNLPVAALALVLAGGCSDSTELAAPVQETTGLLGNGVFRWVCLTSADPTCGTGVFPTMVALNARFDLEFTGSSDLPEDLGLFTLEPVSPTRLARMNASLEGQLAGDVSVVALGGGYGIDYVSLSFLPVDDLLLGEPEPEPSGPCDDDSNSDGVCDGTGGVVSDPEVSLVLGELANVRVRAFGEGADLAGAIEYDFESLTPEIAVLTSAVGRRAQLDVLAMGTARISVRAGDYVEVFEYEVQEPPPDPGTGTGTAGESEGSDTDVGSGSGLDTGTSTGSGSGSDTGAESGSGSESGTGSASSSGGETDGATTTTGGV